MKGHVWFKLTRTLPYHFCGRCGLIDLKNQATKKAMSRPCPGREDDESPKKS